MANDILTRLSAPGDQADSASATVYIETDPSGASSMGTCLSPGRHTAVSGTSDIRLYKAGGTFVKELTGYRGPWRVNVSYLSGGSRSHFVGQNTQKDIDI